MLNTCDENANIENRLTRALIVETEESQRKGIVLALQSYFSEIVSTPDPLEAIRLAQKFPVDVIISDINFHIMDGLEVIRQFRQHFPQVALVILTACTDHDIRDKLAVIGISRFLEKPVNLEELKQTMRDIL